MTSRWPMVPLGGVARPVARPVIPLAGTSYRQIGVRLWGEGAYERESIDGADTKYSRLYRTETGDIIVNKIWARNGSVAVVPPELAGCYASGEFPMFSCDPERLDYNWAHWLMKTRDFWDQCDRQSQGTSGKNRIRPEQLLRILIPLPPLTEQLRIAAKLRGVTARLGHIHTLTAQALHESESLIIAFHSYFSGSRSRMLGELFRPHEVAVSVRHTDVYPQAGIKSFGGGLFSKPAVAGCDTAYTRFNCLYDGAVVLSQVKGWEGAIAVCPSELAGRCVTPEYRTFACVPTEARPGYFSAIITTPWFWRRLAQATRGLGDRRERTRSDDFLRIQIPVPELPHQERGEAIFREMAQIRQLHAAVPAEITALQAISLRCVFEGIEVVT